MNKELSDCCKVEGEHVWFGTAESKKIITAILVCPKCLKLFTKDTR